MYNSVLKVHLCLFILRFICITSLTDSRIFTKNLGPIGSAVLTFIGYKQTNKQTDRQAKFIYRYHITLINLRGENIKFNQNLKKENNLYISKIKTAE